MLAMVVNVNAWFLVKRGVLESIASMLAPTGGPGQSEGLADARHYRRAAHIVEAPIAQALAFRQVGVDVAQAQHHARQFMGQLDLPLTVGVFSFTRA